MVKILVIETDQQIASRLHVSLQAVSRTQTKIVTSMREARLELTKQHYNLAFIPADTAAQNALGLKVVQPDLSVIVYHFGLDESPGDEDLDLFQAVMTLNDLEISLPEIVAQVRWNQSDLSLSKYGASQSKELLSQERLSELCRIVKLEGSVQQIILSRGDEFVAHGWVQSNERAQEVLTTINDSWIGGKRTAQVQYMYSSLSDDPVVLYTQLVGRDLLTLVARRDTPIPELRAQATGLADEMLGISGQLNDIGEVAPTNLAWQSGRLGQYPSSYAIILWTIDAIPTPIEDLISTSIKRVANENDFSVEYLDIQRDHVQIVVLCHVPRTSSWIVNIIKAGIEQDIQGQYGLAPSLWVTGYYVTETDEPLTGAKLDLVRYSPLHDKGTRL